MGPETPDPARERAREAKRVARGEARAARRAIGGEARRAAAAAVAARALELPEVAGARSVLAYAALPEEIDPAPLVEALRSRGARVAFPRVCAPGVLALHWVEGGEPLEPGHAGILEPNAACAWAGPDDFDLVLVPGVAFDASCRRLGFGGGYYDALLDALPATAVTVGLAYAEQMCEAVPHEDHDVMLDAVVTPDGVFRAEG